MPDCYHVISSSLEGTGKHIKECVDEVGGPGELRKLKTDGTKVYSFVYYQERGEAEQYLDALTSCIEGKGDEGHTVHDAQILEDFEELDITFPGYPPDQDPGRSSA